jgi:hypothetical protein
MQAARSKRLLATDRIKFLESRASELAWAGATGNTGAVFKVAKWFLAKSRCRWPTLVDRDGQPIDTEMWPSVATAALRRT